MERAMTWEAIAAILLPLIVYVILEKKKGLKTAVKASLVMATVLVVYFVIRFEFYDKLLWFEYLLLMALGLTTIKLNNDKFFKFQPVIVNGSLGVYIAVVHYVEGPILVRYMPLMKKMIDDPQVLQMMDSQHMLAIMTKMSLYMGLLLIAHAGLCAVAALRWTTVQWMWARLSIYPALIVTSLLASILG
jgi:intracellular septation protein A